MICAGSHGAVALEDTLLAGALVDFLCDNGDVCLNDSAQLAWDCFENHGSMLAESLEMCESGARLIELGFQEDIKAAARIDRFTLAPELRHDPLRIEIAAVGIANRHWTK